MNAHFPTPEQRTAITAARGERMMELECQVNDLARHCRAMYVVADTVFDELRLMAKHLPGSADVLAQFREDFEVMETQIQDAHILSRDLRKAYYREDAK